MTLLRRALLVVGLLVAAVVIPRKAVAEGTHAELVTIGPGSDAFSRYGHSVLCVSRPGTADARCYDFGVADSEEDPAGMVWDTLRGRPRFLPVAIARSVVIETFESHDRSMWTQDLALTESEVTVLAASLEAAVTVRTPYAYHPYTSNCTTRLRDLLDAATSGRLREGADAVASGPRFRALSEQPFSGRVPELAALRLFVGAPSDRQPTEWERMFLPLGLRDAVNARLGAPPKQIHERREIVLPTSTRAGDVALVFLGALLAGATLWARRKTARHVTLMIAAIGAALGILGLAVDIVSLAPVFPELARNWVVLVLMPTDLILTILPRAAVPYLRARLVLLGALAVASAVGMIAQPLFVPCCLVALPLGAAYFVTTRKVQAASATSSVVVPAEPFRPEHKTPDRTA